MVKHANHYYMGFICKCAEYGLEGEIVEEMYKEALSPNDYMANNWNDYTTKMMRERNANLESYRDEVDAGKAGTGLGRFWHGLMDNAVGRSMGIRGSADYLTDAEVSRVQRASQLAQQDVARQNKINAAYGNAPQLDQLAISSVRGYTQQKSQNPTQPKAINTAWGSSGGSSAANTNGSKASPGTSSPGEQIIMRGGKRYKLVPAD